MNYDITHTTTYEYTDPVSVSHHVLRLHPRELDRQRCSRHEMRIDPRPVVVKHHLDYFGNPVSFITVEGAHKKFVVTSRSQVKVEGGRSPKSEDSPAWEAIRALCASPCGKGALEACEFLYSSPLIHQKPEFAEYAAESFPAGRPLREAVLDLTGRIFRDFKFDPRATTVATPLDEMFKARRGVCQDFAHLEIACLRSLGIPARYVSGYLETDPPPGKARLTGADASHAWISCYLGDEDWMDADPTNNVAPSTRHVTAAWGRDYGDVSPIRGVLLGSGDHSLKVAVDVLPV